MTRRTPGGEEGAELALAETTASDVGLADTTASDNAPGGPRADLATLDAPMGAPEVPSPLARLPVVDRDRYLVDGEVARGGLGRILRARDRHLDRDVALKEMLGGGAEAERRFVREALVTARLEHPSIVPVHDAGRGEDGAPFYAMKLVRGRPLNDVIAGAKSTAARLALVPTVLAVADAIAYAHTERVIHRDLKPGNVLVGEFGETVVIDWGLAKDLEASSEAELPPNASGTLPVPAPLSLASLSADRTVDGAILGTPAYMAPEQAAGDEVDERADVYALGAILYELLAGKPPHRGRTLDEVLRKVIAGDLVPLAQHAPDLPRDLAAIVGKAMARDPVDRYPTARELAADLRRYVTGQLVAVYAYRWRERVLRWLRRNRAPVAVATVALAVMIVAGVIAVRRILDERDQARAARAVAVAREAEARTAEQAARVRADELLIAQARGAVEADPTRALAILASLPADSTRWSAARVVAADAAARGVGDVLVGHRSATEAIAIDGDGDRIASLDRGEIRIWDLTARTVRVIARPEPCAARPDCVFDRWRLAMSRDGRRLAAFAGAVTVWEVDDLAAPPITFDAHHGWWLDDGRLVVALGVEGAYQLAYASLIDRGVTPIDPVTAQKWWLSSDGAVAVGLHDGKLSVVRPGVAAETIGRGALEVALSPSGKTLAWTEPYRGAGDGAEQYLTLRVRGIDERATRDFPVRWPSHLAISADDRTVTWDDDAGAWWLSLAPEADLRDRAGAGIDVDDEVVAGETAAVVIAGTSGGVVVLRDRGDRQVLLAEKRGWRMARSGVGGQIAAAGAPVVRTWRIGAAPAAIARPPAQINPPLPPGSPGNFASVTTPELATSRDGTTLVIDWLIEPVERWARKGGLLERVAVLPVEGNADLSVSPDGTALLHADLEATLYTIDGSVERPLGDADVGWFGPDGAAYTIAEDQVIRRWGRDGSGGERVCAVTAPWAQVTVGEDGAVVATLADGRVQRCRLADGVTDELPGVGALEPWVLRRDGTAVAGYDAAAGELVLAGDGARKAVAMAARPAELALSADGRWVIAVPPEGGFTVWDTGSGAVHAVAVPGAAIAAISFIGDDSAAMAVDDGVLVVDLASGVYRMLGSTQRPEAVWTFDDRAIVATVGGQVRLWRDDLPREPAALRAWLLAATNARLGPSGELVMAEPFRPL